ncbi:MAG: hypothetical protein ABI203_07635 [Mucilaginibacter sp.]
MFTRIVFVFLLVIIYCLSAKAQKSDTIYYFAKNQVVKNKDSADFVRIVLPPDTAVDKNLLLIKDYYKNGRLKFIGHARYSFYKFLMQGTCVDYFPNGRKRSIGSFIDNNPVGDFWEYYPNGKIFITGKYDSNNNLQIDECRDTTGNLMAEHGNGTILNTTRILVQLSRKVLFLVA